MPEHIIIIEFTTFHITMKKKFSMVLDMILKSEINRRRSSDKRQEKVDQYLMKKVVQL